MCFKIGRDIKKDVDEIAEWPVQKIYEYMAFWLTENEDFKQKIKDESLTDEEKAQAIMNILKGTGKSNG